MVFAIILCGLAARNGCGTNTGNGLLVTAGAQRREGDFIIGPGRSVYTVGI